MILYCQKYIYFEIYKIIVKSEWAAFGVPVIVAPGAHAPLVPLLAWLWVLTP